MKNKLSHQEKLQKAIMKDSKMKRIPQRDNKVRPIFHTCGQCKKNKVTDHHFLCNVCHKSKQDSNSCKEVKNKC